MVDINIGDLESLKELIQKIAYFESELTDLISSMDGAVNSAEEWWHDRQYEQFAANWDESSRSLMKFLETLPDAQKKLSFIYEKGIEIREHHI